MVKKISRLAQQKLEKLTNETLKGLNGIRIVPEQEKAVKDVARQLLQEEEDYVMSLDSADSNLAVKHANSKGRIAGLTTLIHLIEGSGNELEKREEKK